MVAPALDDSFTGLFLRFSILGAPFVSRFCLDKEVDWATPVWTSSAFGIVDSRKRPLYFSQEGLLVKYRFALLLSTAVIFTADSCSHAQQGAQVDKTFRPAISPDAQTLFSVRLDRLKASEVYRRHEQQLDLPQFNALAERVGLDPRRDLSNVLVEWDGKNLLMLAQGALPTRNWKPS